MKHSLKLLAVNVVLVLVILFGVDQLLGLLGFPADETFRSAHRANVSKTLKTIEFEYQFTTNDLGLRYPPVAPEKPPGNTRILLLGDSFTEGVGVEAADSFGMQLQNHYSSTSGSDVQFINAGLGGEGPVRFWRVFRDVGLALGPDGLLLCLYANDLMDTPDSLKREDLYRRVPERHGMDKLVHGLIPRVYMLMSEASRIVARELRQSGGFVATVTGHAREQDISEEAIETWSKGLPPELVEASDNNEFNKSLLSMGLFHPHYWSEAINITTPKAERKFDAMKIVLDEITAVAREHQIAMGLVYIPAPLQYDPSRHASWNPWIIGGVNFRQEWLTQESEIQARLGQWAQGNSIPFLDLTAVLRAEVERGGKLNFKLDGHWNADGHRVAGKAIVEWIDTNAVFPELVDPR
jgi:lysophospholipase L1-like esterase